MNAAPRLADAALIDARHLVERKVYALSEPGEPWPAPVSYRTEDGHWRTTDPEWYGRTDAARAELERMRAHYEVEQVRAKPWWPPSDAARFVSLITRALRAFP